MALFVFAEGEPEGAALEREGAYLAGVVTMRNLEGHAPLAAAEIKKQKTSTTLNLKDQKVLHNRMRLLRVVVGVKHDSTATAQIRLLWDFEGRRLTEQVEHSWKPVPGVAELFGGWRVEGGRLFLVFYR